ncbi:UDP-N-acetylmuramate dehydrogenase [Parenemella sanctibonifatiensis]|uniref:UDP-N-acetylenolpyruvoylglucosamine reductase n=1 Tax=Parenemella sanctibonifatiensis TaxID=2016505 RepID=A0A255E7K1_9ACTN|nr:UDP-N-acetylenolpyruvoylglucosamine reductase [Parenemella sanctibonifatiensis]
MTEADPTCVVSGADLTSHQHPLGGDRGGELSAYTTLRVGGEATEIVVADTEERLRESVRESDRAGQPVLLVGGGSNMLVGDDGFDGRVVLIRTRGLTFQTSDCAGAMATVAAGEVWDDLVAASLAQQWVGLAPLSGIPGLVGATPIQNVGAYGAEVAETITRVRCWDRQTDGQRTFTADECGFSYRDSRFKQELDRYLILEVQFQFRIGEMSAPIKYAELARRLGVEVGERADAARVREEVLALRAGKGMVLDQADHDTWSAGSFFTNPILTAEAAAKLPAGAPRFPQPDGTVKSSAAWLIQHAGFAPGFGTGPATLSTKHTLALTNRGEAAAADVVALARTVRAGVEDAFGVRLVPEPNLVNCEL